MLKVQYHILQRKSICKTDEFWDKTQIKILRRKWAATQIGNTLMEELLRSVKVKTGKKKVDDMEYSKSWKCDSR